MNLEPSHWKDSLALPCILYTLVVVSCCDIPWPCLSPWVGWRKIFPNLSHEVGNALGSPVLLGHTSVRSRRCAYRASPVRFTFLGVAFRT